jgi:peroxiredoxin
VKNNQLTFSVLADINNAVASQFGLTFFLPEDLKQIYSNFGIDLHRFNGNDSWNLPMSGRFIIDTKGIIRSMEVHPDYTQRPDPSEIIEILQLL